VCLFLSFEFKKNIVRNKILVQNCNVVDIEIKLLTLIHKLKLSWSGGGGGDGDRGYELT